MTYEEKEDSREVILVGYYNVLFYLIFRVGLDEYKKDILIERIRSGERREPWRKKERTEGR